MKWQKDLLKDIRFNSSFDDQDAPGVTWINSPPKEFSDENSKELLNYFLRIKDSCKLILEIGIARNQFGSSYTLINNKKDETTYLGVDLRDGTFLQETKKPNVHTIVSDSGNIEHVTNYIKSIGHQKIDFLFIDGWHSINQVIKEWEYTDLLSENGIVGFHDTNSHPGPYYFIENLDRSKWNVDKLCQYNNDWGISFVYKK